jgi:RNA polymerase sigma-70 factor (ECF subfamily)
VTDRAKRGQEVDVARSAHDEAPEFRALYEREFSFVWRSVRRLGVIEADIPDAVHDVFSVVIRRWEDYDRERPLRGWIYGIARHVAHNARRRRRRRSETDQPLPSPIGPTPEDVVAQRELLLLLLDELDEDRRHVFILADLEGFSGPEISASLDMPLNTVYSRLRLAREQLATQAARLKLRRAV